MSWVLQKILLGRLRNYFHIEDDKNVELSLLSKRQVKCQNLILKNEVINKPQMPVHIKHCSIGLLEISFDGKKTLNKPLNVKLDSVKLTVMFNLNKKADIREENKEKKLSRPVINEFYKAIGSEQEYQQRTFLQEQIYQLKQLFAESALGQLCLTISNIDVNVQYWSDDKPRYFGMEIFQIQAKQEVIIKGNKISQQHRANEVHCEIKNLRAYFGVKIQQNPLFKQADPRQIFKKLEKMRKKYILNSSLINVLYSFGQNSLTILSSEVNFDFEDILIHEVLNFINFASDKFKDQPPLKPNQGQIKSLGIINGRQFTVSQGTLLWWQFFGDKLIQKFKRRANTNILNNNKFRNYLYCLLYRYTFGADINLEKIVDNYEYFKSDMQILKYNKLVISKVNKIRRTKNDKQIDDQTKVFMIFLLNIQKKDHELSKVKLKKITYNEIRNSNVIVNYYNCKKYVHIQEAKQINCLTIDASLKKIIFKLKRAKIFPQMKSQIVSLSPMTYAINKKTILSYYCNQSIIDQNENVQSKKQDKKLTKLSSKINQSFDNSKSDATTYVQIEITSLKVEMRSQDNMYISMPEIQINDVQSKTQILKTSGFFFSVENMHPEVYGWKIEAEKRMQIKIELFFFYLQSKFVQKLLTVVSYINEIEKQSPEEQKNFITQFIAKKVPSHPIFNTYQSTSKQILIKRIVFATPVFDSHKTFQINMKGFKYADPINGRPSFGINQILILRSNEQNLQNKISPIHHGVKFSDQVVMMANTRQFSGQIIKEATLDVTSLVIPFILIQISCQDLYYISNIMKIWVQIISNPFYFPPKIVKKNQHIPQINPNSVKFARQMKQFSKHQKMLDLRLEGLQFCLLSDYLNEGNNLIIDLLVDNFSIKSQSGYTEDKMQIKLKDVFIRNFLSFKQINKQALITSIKDQLKFGDEPILVNKQKRQDASQSSNAKMNKNEQLLLFTDSPNLNQNKQQNPFLSLVINSIVNLQQAKSVTQTSIKIIPLFIFYSLEFTDMIRIILSTINYLSSENLGVYQNQVKNTSFGTPFSFYQPNTATTADTIQTKQETREAQIMAATQFQQVNRLSVLIQKLNFFAVKNSSVVYTMSIWQIKVKHRSQPYLQRFFFSLNRLLIVDTSQQAGPQPIIIDLQKDSSRKNSPMEGSFTTYNSQIMKFKQKKSAYFVLIIDQPEIYFLKKKVLELVNFLMITLRQVGVLAQPEQQIASKPKTPPNEPPFCYSITMKKPKIRLFRSSLSQQGFKAIAESIQVNNFKRSYNNQQQAQQQAQNLENSILRGLQEIQQNINAQQSFQEMKTQKGNEQIQFQSFQKQKDGKSVQTVQKIYIEINQFLIFGAEYWDNQFKQLYQQHTISPMLYIPFLNIQFFSPEMIVTIPRLAGDMADEDYRVLIRMTEQNLSESPLLFVDNPRVQAAIRVSFRTTFLINQIGLSINIFEENLSKRKEKLKKKICINLTQLSGKNELWTNNQIFTQLSIHSLDLETQDNVTIVQRLHQQVLKDLPQIPKSNIYTDIAQYPQFNSMERSTRRHLNKILQKQVEQMQVFAQPGGKEEFGNENQISAKQKTNFQKISQWVKGMLKKCCKGCKCCRKQYADQGDDLITNILNLNARNQDKQQYQMAKIQLLSNSLKDRTAPMIYKIQEVLDFQYQINESHISKKKKQPDMIYLNFVIRPNGEKQMYMQAKKIQVLLENSKGLLGLAQFFGRPYSVSDIPENVRKYKFNNNKPFKMLIEVDDTLAQIQAVNQEGKIEKVCVLCDLVYDNQARGDSTIGPGLTIMRVQSVAKILFMSEHFKYPIDLSDSFKAIFISQNRIPYGQDQRNQSIQKILLKPHERQDWNISFFIPAYALKAISRIILSNFSKIQSEDEQKANIDKQQQRKVDQQTNLDQQNKNRTIKKTLSHTNQTVQRQTIKNDPALSKKASDGLKNKLNAQKDGGKEMIKQHKRKQMNQPPPPPTTKQSHMIRCMYVTQITFEIQSKLESSFIKSKIKDTQYSQLFMNNKDNKINTRNILALLDVNYWNLKLGVYEPCIQPWSFKVQQIVHQRDNLSSSSFKVSSNPDSWKKIEGDYVNDLNVNISIPLYQTSKELMIVYQQENFDDNEDCYDLTTENSDYDGLFGRVRKTPLIGGKKNKKFPKKLVKYFTRIFRHNNQNLKKYLTSTSKNFFNPPYLRLYLYHSYFDHFRRKKCITYRTPYRIFNATNVDIIMWFYDPKLDLHWKIILKMYEYYAIPQKIYQTDFLVHFTDKQQEPPKGSPYVSVKYLIQMKAKKKSFKKIDQQSVIWKNIFKYSSIQTQKFVDPRDLIVKIGDRCFTAISVFSKHEPKDQQNGYQSHLDEIKFYDAYCILQSPIIIDNYTYMDLNIKVDRNAVIKIPKNQRVQINQPLSSLVSSTLIQFQNDSLHQQRRILKQKIGNTHKVMEIQKLQSVKLLITRQTTSSCLIKIYTQWNVSNLTNECFSLKNSQKLFLIDRMSFSCLSTIALKGIDLCIVNQQKHSKKIKPNNIADVITLAKKKQNEELQSIVKAKRKHRKTKLCGCFGGSSTIYEHIDFVLNSTQDPIEPLNCRKIEIRYRYQILNKTISQIRLCQFSKDFIIACLPPFKSAQNIKPTYIYHYDFIPQVYFFQIQVFEAETQNIKTITSCTFNLDQFPGSTFVLKIKKDANNIELQEYEKRFYYYQVEIKKNEEQSLIQIKNADLNDFPIYIDNVTDYHIKIAQGEDQFIIKPQNRVPFAWSHLISNDYKLEASIEGVDSKQAYLFNNKSAFQPIKIVDKNKKKKKKAENLYLKQFCYVQYEYMSLSTVCLVILDLFDNKLRIHNKEQNINSQFKMSYVQKLEPLASKIQIHFGGSDVMEIVPPSKVIKLWIKKLQQCINQDVIDKIFFTIQSYNNSRIFFFRTIGQEECESSRQQYLISHLNVSLISAQPQQIILLYCGDISYIQHDKQNKLNYKNLELSESQRTITLKKIKVSNQTRDAINPVVLSRIKKSNYPFLEVRLIQQKLHLQADAKGKYTADQQLQVKEEEQKITHYKQITFFMDEAQVMVEAALFLKIFSVKKNFDDITNQYAVGAKMSEKDMQLVVSNQINTLANANRISSQAYRKSVKLVNIDEQAQQVKNNPQVYINYLQIKPLKITASVYLGHNEDQDIKMDLITILRYIPFGIENAIIEIESYQFFHVFYDMQELKKQLMKFYTKQAWNQIYKNAGSYDMLLPIQFIGGVGNGVKKIFYDPIYELVRKKEIKAVGKSFAEGLLSFIAFLVNFFLKLINLAFKILALFTFDQQYRTKRQSFRKQIFKSPVQGAVLGAKNFWNVFKSFFVNFTQIKKNWGEYSIFGYFFGFIVCVLQIAPWVIKLIVSFYDWFYVICLGIVNWGYYEQSAMKSRSRPRRIFYHKQIIPYNYLLSLGNQIIRQNQLQQIDNEQIFFVKSIQGGDDNSHLILSNYRIIHNYYKTAAMHQIKLYQLSDVESRYKNKKNQYRLYIRLSIPYVSKVLFLFSYNISQYKLNFIDRADIVSFLKYLKHLSLHQKLNIKFFDDPAIQNQFNTGQYMLMEIVDQEIKAAKETYQKNDDDDEVIRERDRWTVNKKQNLQKKTENSKIYLDIN